MSTTLPTISGLPEYKTNNPEHTSPTRSFSGEGGVDHFAESIDNLASVPFPDINADATMKQRILTLEETAGSQNVHNRTAHDSFINLNNNLLSADQNIKELMLAMQREFDNKIADMRKEYDHRFELQNSENKRMQNHVASLKADTNQLKRKLQTTIEKLRKLQREFGDPDEIEEESSILSPSYSNASRPNTTGF